MSVGSLSITLKDALSLGTAVVLIAAAYFANRGDIMVLQADLASLDRQVTGRMAQMDQRLVRIEDKLDKLIQRQ